MVRSRLGILLLSTVAGCGAKPAPAPTPVAATPKAPPASPTCADAGAILRGAVDFDEAKAGPAREAAIADACEADHWPPAVLACVTDRPSPWRCLRQLTAAQRDSYQARLDAWDEQWGGDGYGGLGYGGIPATTGPTVHVVSCDDLLLHDVAAYPPALGDGATERDWTIAARQKAIQRACRAEPWSDEVTSCLDTAADDSAAIAACLDHLPQPSRAGLASRLGELAKLADAIASARKKPAAISCKKVVAVHYSDAAWKGKLDHEQPAARKKLISESRARMTKACTTDHWNETLRACLVAKGEDTCFEASGVASLWGYPAAALQVSTGVPECDAYGAEILRLQSCQALPQSAREALLQAFQQASAAWANLPASTRATLADACKAGYEAVKQAATMCP